MSSLANATDCIARSGENFSEILNFIQLSNTIVARVPGTCSAGITENDKIEIKKMQADLLLESKKKKGNLASIISAYELKLSTAAVAAILSASAQNRMKLISLELKQNPDLAESLKEFDAVVSTYNKNRNRIFGGTRGISEKGFLGGNEDNIRLDNATLKLKNSLKIAKLDPKTKNILTKNMYLILSNAYHNASVRALQGARNASIGLFWSSSILAADLITFSILTGGSATPVSGAGLQIALATVSGAASAAGFVGADGLGKMVVNSTFQKKEGKDFFCKLADEVNYKGREVLHNALIGAVAGGAFGAGVSGISLFSTTAAKVVSGGTSVALSGKTGTSAIKSGWSARKYHELAKEARKKGNYAAADELENSAKRAAVDAAAGALESGVVITAKSIKRHRTTVKKNIEAEQAD